MGYDFEGYRKRKEEITSLYFQYLKESYRKLSFPVDYKDDLNYYANREYLNCYAYAMQFKMSNAFIRKFKKSARCTEFPIVSYTPGFLTGKTPPFHYRKNGAMVELFLSDLEALGLDYIKTDVSSVSRPDSYKVALVWENYVKAWHFIRENKNNLWSEKTGYYKGKEYIREISINKVSSRYEIVEVIEISKPKTLIL